MQTQGAAARALAQFSVCRQPWNDYISALGKQDDVPYEAEPHLKPMYRGRKRGFEEWYTGAGVQMHYRKFPDEQLFSNLTRYRQGDLVGDIRLQQFRVAQPHKFAVEDEQGLDNPNTAEDYMKLNYKNPATIGKFLTRGGHYYHHKVLPINPKAFNLLRNARYNAIKLGLFPRHGNPFWQRNLQFRPKPQFGEYDPSKASTKETMAAFAFNWLKVNRIKSYFEGLERNRAHTTSMSGSAEDRMQGGWAMGERDSFTISTPGDYMDSTVGYSSKNPTVPGLMSTTGLKKPRELYSSVGKRRMGFDNPLKKLVKI